MRAADLTVVAPDPTRHAEAIYGLIDLEWPGTGEHCREGRIAHSHYDWGASRIGVLGGEVVTHFGVYELVLRVGVARVRTGGVNLVLTHPEHRGRGLMTETTRAALRAMREGSYHISVLCNATEGYYGRFGYVPVWPETRYTARVEDLPAGLPEVRARPFEPGHREDLAALYNRLNETLTGTAVRPTYRRTKEPGGLRGSLWSGPDGEVGGYVVYDLAPEAGLLWLDDSAGGVEERLRVLRVLAGEHGCERLVLSRIPREDPLCRELRALGCTVEERYSGTGGWMARVLDLGSLLRALAPELERRLSRSSLAGWHGELALATEDEEAVLGIEGGRVRVLGGGSGRHSVRGGTALVRLLLGSSSVRETVEGWRVELRGDASQLVEALFPAQHPALSNADL